MTKIYLTIDDSPSPYSDELVDYLTARGIQAVFYCIGSRLRDNPAPMLRAIQQGHIIANHSYSHPRFSELSLDECIDEIAKTETIIDDLYQQAGVARPVKLFRFPHLDRGAGGAVIDFNKIAADHRDFVRALFMDGVNLKPVDPTPQQLAHKQAIQDYLTATGFKQVFAAVSYPWFTGTEMETACDSVYTFSTSDWMLLDRHRGKWPYKTLDDLKRKIDDDIWLNNADSASIVLAHDKPEPELFPVVKSLIDHMVDKGYQFLKIK